MKTPAEEATRRSLLRTIGAGVVATSVVAGSASAQEDGVAQRFEFEGETAGWIAVAPSEIEGETNPTLSLEAGETYEFYWENTDDAPHNVVIEDAEGNPIESTEVIRSGDQTLRFTATQDMASYYCEVHPSSMRGDIEVPGGSTATSESTATPEQPTSADDAQDDTTETNGPGFTVAGTLSAIGAGALLRAYRNRGE